ncbi:MAG: hypothetical protein BA863_12800 [Desulfovibrio sp. S3730MH75]|nr:MAG: hypothetical protein BA863_12800 [Desulfovibrio sp. S3730MH75]
MKSGTDLSLEKAHEKKAHKRTRVSRNVALLVAVTLIVTIAMLSYRHCFRQKVVGGLSQLEEVFNAYGFTMYKPPREGKWGVGTIFRLVEGEPLFVMEPKQVLSSNLAVNLDRAGIPNLSLTGSFAGEGTAIVKSLADMTLSYDQNIRVHINFHNPKIESVPVSKLKESLEKTQSLRRYLQHPSELFVITEALRIDGIKYVITSRDHAGGGIELSKHDLPINIKGKFRIDAGNHLSANFPLYVGYKAHKLTTISTALGGSSIIQLHPFSPMEIESERKRSSDVSLTTDFQVFGLLIGLGNYQGYSERIGGLLTGANDSVDIMANDISRIPGAIVERLVRDYSPNTRPEEGYISRDTIMDKVHDFVGKYGNQMNDNSLLIFYYFGHGLSEPLSRKALLIPEDFNDRPEKEIRELWGELVFVHDVVNQLKKLPGSLLILIDSCRMRKRSDEIQPQIALEPVLPPGVGSLIRRIDVVPFPNLFASPVPVIFSSPDREQAKVVPHVMPNGYVKRVGPLAEGFDKIWRTTLGKQGFLTLRGLIQEITKPRQDHVPIGYMATAGDLRAPERILVKINR